jgi:hypothetical protein
METTIPGPESIGPSQPQTGQQLGIDQTQPEAMQGMRLDVAAPINIPGAPNGRTECGTARRQSARSASFEVQLHPVGCPGRHADPEEVAILGPDWTLQHQRGRNERPVVRVP